jgi:hypothetical protein
MAVAVFILLTVVLALFVLTAYTRNHNVERFTEQAEQPQPMVYDSNNYDLVYHDELPIPEITSDLLNGGTMSSEPQPTPLNYETSVYLSPPATVSVDDLSGNQVSIDQVLAGNQRKTIYGFPYVETSETPAFLPTTKLTEGK